MQRVLRRQTVCSSGNAGKRHTRTHERTPEAVQTTHEKYASTFLDLYPEIRRIRELRSQRYMAILSHDLLQGPTLISTQASQVNYKHDSEYVELILVRLSAVRNSSLLLLLCQFSTWKDERRFKNMNKKAWTMQAGTLFRKTTYCCSFAENEYE